MIMILLVIKTRLIFSIPSSTFTFYQNIPPQLLNALYTPLNYLLLILPHNTVNSVSKVTLLPFPHRKKSKREIILFISKLPTHSPTQPTNQWSYNTSIVGALCSAQVQQGNSSKSKSSHGWICIGQGVWFKLWTWFMQNLIWIQIVEF